MKLSRLQLVRIHAALWPSPGPVDVGENQWHPQSAQHRFPRIPSTPSLAMIGTITNPATGSAHHQPNNAFSSNPPNRIADRYVQKSACLESAFMAPLPIPAATRRFALASNGMTTTETAATMMPGMLRSGSSWRIRRGAGFVDDVQRQRNEAPADDSQRDPFNLFTAGMVEIVVEPPQQRRPGGHFDQAVQAEADQRNGPGDQPGDDGDQTFGAVVGDGEVFEPLAPANKPLPILSAGRRHWSIIPERRGYRRLRPSGGCCGSTGLPDAF